jgi:hypothetical protein
MFINAIGDQQASVIDILEPSSIMLEYALRSGIKKTISVFLKLVWSVDHKISNQSPVHRNNLRRMILLDQGPAGRSSMGL